MLVIIESVLKTVELQSFLLLPFPSLHSHSVLGLEEEITNAGGSVRSEGGELEIEEEDDSFSYSESKAESESVEEEADEEEE